MMNFFKIHRTYKVFCWILVLKNKILIMSKKMFLLSLLFFSNKFLMAQSLSINEKNTILGKVRYTIYSQPRKCTLTDTTAVLYLKKSGSLFVYSKGKSMQMVTCEKGEDVLLFEPLGNMILKNYDTDSLKIREFVVTTIYQSKEEIPKFDWVLGTKEKQIGKFRVKNATTSFRGREYEVWFTEEIPISDGPWKFNGLPGLILEAYDNNKEYVFTLKNVEIPTDNIQGKADFVEDGHFLPINQFLKADYIEFEKIKKESQAASGIDIEVKMPPRNPIELTEN